MTESTSQLTAQHLIALSQTAAESQITERDLAVDRQRGEHADLLVDRALGLLNEQAVVLPDGSRLLGTLEKAALQKRGWVSGLDTVHPPGSDRPDASPWTQYFHSYKGGQETDPSLEAHEKRLAADPKARPGVPRLAHYSGYRRPSSHTVAGKPVMFNDLSTLPGGKTVCDVATEKLAERGFSGFRIDSYWDGKQRCQVVCLIWDIPAWEARQGAKAKVPYQAPQREMTLAEFNEAERERKQAMKQRLSTAGAL
jgi:hypothetical protein